MKRKKLLSDPSFWILIVINGYLVYHYYQHPEIFATLIWLYWSQSMLLGLFTILDLLTVRNTTPITYKVDNVVRSLADDRRSRWSSAKFFIIVYGILHLIYLLFLLAGKKSYAPVQW